MISEGQSFLTVAPWLVLCPGVAILLTVLAFTLMGNGLRDALDVKVTD
jgi:peptide/nickel transport system permease protein/oligopeptide transport system permease protein